MELGCPTCGMVSRVDPVLFKAAGRLLCPTCRTSLEVVEGGTGKAALPEVAEPGEIPLRFTGSGGAYFRIWIVSLALTILTLGVYSAWAKVRRKRFFYGHTLLEESSFDYLGDPRRILLGRAILVGMLLALGVASRFAPDMTDLVSNLLLMLLFPWLVVKARGFNLRNSAYRNLRFDFNGRYLTALRLYLLYPLLLPLTLGLFMPYMVRAQQLFLAERSRYGLAFGALHAEAKLFVRLYLRMAALFLVVPLLLGGVAWGVASWGGPTLQGVAEEGGWALLQFGLPVLVLFFYAYYQAIFFNLVWNHLGLGELRFRSRLQPWRMVWITLSNTVLILASLGLLMPWAKVRAVRYRLESLSVLVGRGGLEGFVCATREEVGAAGEEIGDFLDVDIGL